MCLPNIPSPVNSSGAWPSPLLLNLTSVSLGNRLEREVKTSASQRYPNHPT